MATDRPCNLCNHFCCSEAGERSAEQWMDHCCDRGSPGLGDGFCNPQGYWRRGCEQQDAFDRNRWRNRTPDVPECMGHNLAASKEDNSLGVRQCGEGNASAGGECKDGATGFPGIENEHVAVSTDAFLYGGVQPFARPIWKVRRDHLSWVARDPLLGSGNIR